MKRPMNPGPFPGVTHPDYLRWEVQNRKYDIEIAKFNKWFGYKLDGMARELLESGEKLGDFQAPIAPSNDSKEAVHWWLLMKDLQRIHGRAIELSDTVTEVKPVSVKHDDNFDVGEWLDKSGGKRRIN